MNPEDRLPDEQIRAALERQRRRIAAHVDARAGLDHAKETHPMRRALVPALAAAAVVVAVLGGIAVLNLFGAEEPPVAAPVTTSSTVPTTEPPPGSTTTTTTPTTTSTAVPPTITTTTTEPIVVGTTPPPPIPGDEVFLVAGVAADDVLNVRAEPDPGTPKVGELAPGAAVPSTGLAVPDVPVAGWWEVALADGTRGWVNRRFVGLDPALATGGCAEQTVEPVTFDAVPGVGDAGHVLGYDFFPGGACGDRFVVLFGAGDGWSTDWALDLANGLPDGVTVSPEGPVVAITLPPQIQTVRPTATEADFGDMQAFVVRDFPTGSTPGPLEIRLHFGRNVTVAAQVLANPARIVVDLGPEPTGTGLDYTPVLGNLVVLERPIQIDLSAPGVDGTIGIRGYGRPFEAQGFVEIRRAADQPGTGETVPVVYDGGLSETGLGMYIATDYVDTWGRFAFDMEIAEPGDYEMFIGEFSADDGTPIGLYHTFTVVGG